MYRRNCTSACRAVTGRASWQIFLNLLAVGLITTGIGYAQLAGTGAIAGSIQDPSGAVVPGATVTAVNVATNVRTTRATTSTGDYNITPLSVGTYTVTVAAVGFQGYRQE